MKTAIFAAVASLALAAAAPSSSNSCASKKELATFDDLAAVPGASELTPVGTYDGLKYNSWTVLSAGVAGDVVAGVKPQSGHQTAITSLTDSVLNGAPAFIPASGYKTLSLKSLYFGCVANTATSLLGVPEQCTVSFTAYKPGSTKAYQTINQQFDPSNAVLSKMAKATFPSSWQKMGKIEIAVVQSTTGASLTGSTD